VKNTKETFVFGFALFAGFFGAGNLILPPFLGFHSGSDWSWVAVGFLVSTTVIPLCAISAHAKLQGTMFDFGKKVSPLFSSIFCFVLLVITTTLPCPRTAAVTHEIAIAPFFASPALLTSIVYFFLVFLFVMNRSQVLSFIGKFLTPIILIILFAIILLAIYAPATEIEMLSNGIPFVNGLLEGYQTYDAMAGVIMGAVVLTSLNRTFPQLPVIEKKAIIFRSGVIAMTGLFVVYVGLIFVGAKYSSQFIGQVSRTELLLGIANKTLGSLGASILGALVALACFTTAVAIVVSVADFFKAYFPKVKSMYLGTAIVCCVVGVLVGQMNVGYIINIAVPALMLVYPLCIVLILLHIIPERLASKLVFRVVAITTIFFSIPDALGVLITSEKLNQMIGLIPLGEDGVGWVFPSIIACILVNFYERLS